MQEALKKYPVINRVCFIFYFLFFIFLFVLRGRSEDGQGKEVDTYRRK